MIKEIFSKYLEYDRENGQFIWINHWSAATAGRFVGKIAGSEDCEGYLQIVFNYKNYKIHRLVYLWETGKTPKQIDHIDGNVKNNKIENLRAATARSNCQNKKIHRNGKLVGAGWRPKLQKWESQAWIKGKKIYLGCFETELGAHNAYMKAVHGLYD